MGVTSVRLTDELQDRLEQTAERLRRSKGWVISEALGEFVAREERQLERLERSRKALGELDSGHTVVGDEVMDWLSTWGTDQETTSPGS